jgi:hypothetical protein
MEDNGSQPPHPKDIWYLWTHLRVKMELKIINKIYRNKTYGTLTARLTARVEHFC